MKKITLLLALLLTSFAFSQTITITSPADGEDVEIGSTIMLTISYTGAVQNMNGAVGFGFVNVSSNGFTTSEFPAIPIGDGTDVEIPFTVTSDMTGPGTIGLALDNNFTPPAFVQVNVNFTGMASGALPTLSMVNPDVLTDVFQGEEVTIEVNYTGFADDAPITVDYQSSNSTQVTLADLRAAGQGNNATTAISPDGSFEFTFMVPNIVPDGEDSVTEAFFLFGTGISGDFVNGNVNDRVVFVDEVTLSNDSFSKENIAASISQSEGLITIGSDIETESYELYDLSGAKVIDQKANGSIDVSGLSSGVYILATDAGLTKVAF